MHPKLAEAHRLVAAGRHDAALKAARLAAAVAPADPDSHTLAARLLLASHRADLASEHSAAIARLRPDEPAAHAFHAGVLAMIGRSADAIASAQRALDIDPRNLVALTNLAAALVNSNQPAAALAVVERGLAIAPHDANLHNTRAQAFHAIGRNTDALASLAQVLRVAPMDPNARISTASFPNYLPNIPRDASLQAHLEFGRFAARGAPSAPRPPMPDTGRKLRVGFISSDFRTHSVAFFIEPILEHLPRERFEVFAYSTSPRADDTTRRLQSRADTWRDLPPTDSIDHAQRIASDHLHAIVEIAGLTRGHSLHALALRPAPLQIAYLGYPNTTGCAFMDARIVDALTDPPDADAFHTERLLRLGAPFVCYRPPDDLPPITPRPDRPPTFACFGAAGKHNDTLFDLWALALDRVPSSRLLIKALGLAEDAARDALRARLAARSIDPARVEILPPSASIAEHLHTYNRADAALDTFPYHGTTTTCEALAMGLPVVSRVGDRHASRVGLTLLSAAGLAPLAADSDAAFADAAARAVDPRSDTPHGEPLRARLLASPLCDGPAFAARFGTALEREILSARHAP